MTLKVGKFVIGYKDLLKYLELPESSLIQDVKPGHDGIEFTVITGQEIEHEAMTNYEQNGEHLRRNIVTLKK